MCARIKIKVITDTERIKKEIVSEGGDEDGKEEELLHKENSVEWFCWGEQKDGEWYQWDDVIELADCHCLRGEVTGQYAQSALYDEESEGQSDDGKDPGRVRSDNTFWDREDVQVTELPCSQC